MSLTKQTPMSWRNLTDMQQLRDNAKKEIILINKLNQGKQRKQRIELYLKNKLEKEKEAD